jgi:N-carbamoylputrescine amidase
MSRPVTLGLIQMRCSDDIDVNFNKAITHIKGAARQGAQIVCTQELFKSLYFCQVEDSTNFKLAEVFDEDNPTLKILGELAA